MEKYLQLRNDYQQCIKQANETDSKRLDSSLREEAKNLLNELCKICPHKQIVVLRSKYSGSHSYDYDDEHPEHRICLCCGVEESAYEVYNFKKTCAAPIARFEGRCPEHINKPLMYPLSEITALAKLKGYVYFK